MPERTTSVSAAGSNNVIPVNPAVVNFFLALTELPKFWRVPPPTILTGSEASDKKSESSASVVGAIMLHAYLQLILKEILLRHLKATLGQKHL